MAKVKTLHSVEGTARLLEISRSLARLYFKSGFIKPDYLIDGRRPLVTPNTLRKVVEQLKAERRR